MWLNYILLSIICIFATIFGLFIFDQFETCDQIQNNTKFEKILNIYNICLLTTIIIFNCVVALLFFFISFLEDNAIVYFFNNSILPKIFKFFGFLIVVSSFLTFSTSDIHIDCSLHMIFYVAIFDLSFLGYIVLEYFINKYIESSQSSYQESVNLSTPIISQNISDNVSNDFIF